MYNTIVQSCHDEGKCAALLHNFTFHTHKIFSGVTKDNQHCCLYHQAMECPAVDHQAVGHLY